MHSWVLSPNRQPRFERSGVAAFGDGEGEGRKAGGRELPGWPNLRRYGTQEAFEGRPDRFPGR